MNRDGFNKSLWQDKLPDFKAAHFEPDNSVYDVIIVGGGVTGITTALELQKSGMRCLVAEAHNLCFGTTGGTTAHLNSFFDKTYAETVSDFGKKGAERLAAAARDALELYRGNIQEMNIACDYREVDGYVFARNEKQVKELDDMYTSSLAAGVVVRYADNIPLNISFLKAICYPGQAQIHPVKYVYALALAFEQSGGRILENCFVSELVTKDTHILHSNQGEFKARNVIYATHIPPGVNLLHMRCAPYRSYVMAIELEDDNYPENPAYDMMDPYHYYRTQETDGRKYLIAGGEDHKTGHEEDTERPFHRLEHYLRGIFKIKEIKFKWSSQYFEPVDGLPYIGHLPGAADNVFVATGFGGNGMVYSHVAANFLTARITKHQNLYDDLFSPDRLKPIAGFTAFVKENVDVVSSLIKDRFNIDKISSIADTMSDTGQVAKVDEETVALYKNKAGDIFAVNPVCTHLKCIVSWNQTEKSWDCPCHGARYAITGEVITGPSTRGLSKIELGVKVEA